MRIVYILLLAALGASGTWRAGAIGAPLTTNRVLLSWSSAGLGAQYSVQTSTDLKTWTAATNTTGTQANLAFTGDQVRMFRLAVSNAPSPSLTLAWDPSVPATNVAGYTIWYGLSSQTYTAWVDVGPATTGVISNLLAGTTYYLAITAYSAAGMESDFSSEVVAQTQAAGGGALKIQTLP